MAQHAIEDLIEETVYLIDKADAPDQQKREWLASLYSVQSLYDTGYTHFRVIDILLKYRFVYRILLSDQPDTFQSFEGNTGWIKNYLTDEVAYATHEDGQIYLYIDAGSRNWARLCEIGLLNENDCTPLTTSPALQLINDLLREAEKQQRLELITQWYGLLVNSYLDGTFGTNEGLSDNFDDLLRNPAFLNIREIAQRNQVKRNKRLHEDIRLPLLADEVTASGGPEKEYIARLFLELRKTSQVLQKGFEQACKAHENGANLTGELLNGSLNAQMVASGWLTALQPTPNIWLWYKDVSAGRRFAWVIYEEDDKALIAYQGLQHKLLLKWQQRKADIELAHLHFYQMVIASVPEDRLQDKKIIHPHGGWYFDAGKPRKTLQANIDHLANSLALAETAYFNYLDAHFPEAYFTRDPQELVLLAEDGVDGTGVVPEHVLFDSAYSILLVFAYHYQAINEPGRTKLMLDLIEEKLKNKSRRNAYDERYLSPLLTASHNGRLSQPMPPIYHHLLMKSLL